MSTLDFNTMGCNHKGSKKVRDRFNLYFYTKTKVQGTKATKVAEAAEAAKAAKAATGLKLNIWKRINQLSIDNNALSTPAHVASPTSTLASDENSSPSSHAPPMLNLAITWRSMRSKGVGGGSGRTAGLPRENHSQDEESPCPPSLYPSRHTMPPLAQQQPDPERHEATVDISAEWLHELEGKWPLWYMP